MNVLIIGFGSIGQRHYNILSKFPTINEIIVITKQTINNIKIVENLSDIDLNKFDYIIIATKTSLHFEQLAFIESNVKDKIILVEKPLSNKKESLKKANNHIYIAYNRRFNPIIEKIKLLIHNNICFSINVHTGQYLPNWRPSRDYTNTYSAKKEEGGGVLLDLSHDIDYIQYLCGEMKIISAINKKISDLNISSDDFCTVLAITKANTFVNFTIDYISKEFIQNIVMHLKDFSIYADLVSMNLKVVYKDSSIKEYSYENYDKNISYEKMHKDILLEEKKISCTFEEGLNIMNKIGDIKKVNYAC
jgi:predicted dehydrogenase